MRTFFRSFTACLLCFSGIGLQCVTDLRPHFFYDTCIVLICFYNTVLLLMLFYMHEFLFAHVVCLHLHPGWTSGDHKACADHSACGKHRVHQAAKSEQSYIQQDSSAVWREQRRVWCFLLPSFHQSRLHSLRVVSFHPSRPLPTTSPSLPTQVQPRSRTSSGKFSSEKQPRSLRFHLPICLFIIIFLLLFSQSDTLPP